MGLIATGMEENVSTTQCFFLFFMYFNSPELRGKSGGPEGEESYLDEKWSARMAHSTTWYGSFFILQ